MFLSAYLVKDIQKSINSTQCVVENYNSELPIKLSSDMNIFALTESYAATNFKYFLLCFTVFIE